MLSRVEGLDVHLTLAAIVRAKEFSFGAFTGYCSSSPGTCNNEHFWRASLTTSDARDRLPSLRASASAAVRLRPEKLPGRKRGFRRM
jgi:hypothetical protein